MNSVNVERRFAAILAADVVKYSIHMADNEERTLQRFGERRAVFTEFVTKRRGRMFGEAGDALLAEFASPVEAVRAAVEVQQALAKKDQEQPELKPFQFRIGINLGDVMVDGENLYGEGVNLASRVEGLAEPGGVAISSHVHTYIRNKVDFGFEDQGPHRVKNAAEPVRIYKLLFSKPGEAPIEAPVEAPVEATTASTAPNPAVPPKTTTVAAPPLKRAPARLRRPLSKRPVRPGDAGFEAAMATALSEVQRSADIEQDGDRLPWFLFLGGSDSGVADLLEAAAKGSPFDPPLQPSPAETFHWSWWIFKEMVAIETGQAFVEEPSEADRHDAWSKALSALQGGRPTMPLAGIVVCIPRQILMDDGARRQQAKTFRRLLDQVATTFGASLPVYLLITRLDDIAGFAAFKETLPAGVEQQVIGYVVEDPVRFGGSGELQKAALQPIFDRFSSLRLGMLRDEGEPARKQAIFDFIHGFSELAAGMSALVDLLTAPGGEKPAIKLRGLFLLANGVEPAFYQDLFARFLPQDQPLAHLWTNGKPDRAPRLSQTSTASSDHGLEIRPMRR